MSTEIAVALIGAVASIAAAVIGVWVKRRRDRDDDSLSTTAAARRRRHKYDLFISSPLAAFANEAELQGSRECIEQIVALAETQFEWSVYWAGRTIRSKQDFDAADLSAKRDVAAILDSKYFLMIYPQKIVSSVLFEAGIALRSCLTSIYIVRNLSDLPFLMSQASQAFTNVRTYQCNEPADALAMLKKHGKAFFDQLRGDGN